MTFGDQWKAEASKDKEAEEKLIWREQSKIYIDEFFAIEHLDESALSKTVWAVTPSESTF